MFTLRSTFRLVASHCNLHSKSVNKNYSAMRLTEVVQAMESFAPIRFAEKWDNVGVLIEPSTSTDIKRIFLTNDLTENVLEEALEKKANLIISYHPPIFSGLKRLTMAGWKERIILQCIENRIALYSPHTSWDACPNGINDWLAGALPIASSTIPMPSSIDPNYGAGRVCELNGSTTLRQVIDKIKIHTGVPDLRVAIASNGSLDSPINNFGVCAGSGGSVLKEITTPIDLFITGELSHHEALEAIHRQIHVITLNHSNSERGYLKKFKKTLAQLLKNNEMEIIVSQKDADPLVTY